MSVKIGKGIVFEGIDEGDRVRVYDMVGGKIAEFRESDNEFYPFTFNLYTFA